MNDSIINSLQKEKKESWFNSRAWRVFRKHKLANIGLVILVTFILLGAFAPVITVYDPNAMNLRNMYKPPTREHLLGTDRIGRDYMTRLIYGTRVSLSVGLGGVFVAALIGITLGGISGFIGGKIDAVLLKSSEMIICFPSLILILLLVTIVGQSVINIILIFGFTQWVSLYRLVRSLFLSLREQEFVEALKAFGVKRYSIMFRHMLPNAVAPITVWVTLSLAVMILEEAGLSFLGLGVPIDVPSWGNLLNTARDLRVLKDMPWLWVPPGIIISLAVLSINFLGDGLRDALNPKQ